MDQSPFCYAETEPGVIRLAACVDFGCIQTPFTDEARIQFIKRKVTEFFGIENPELHNLHIGLRPISPDNLEIIGPMKQYPNVILNVGYGPNGFHSIGGSQIVESIIQGSDWHTNEFSNLHKMVEARRYNV